MTTFMLTIALLAVIVLGGLILNRLAGDDGTIGLRSRGRWR